MCVVLNQATLFTTVDIVCFMYSWLDAYVKADMATFQHFEWSVVLVVAAMLQYNLCSF